MNPSVTNKARVTFRDLLEPGQMCSSKGGSLCAGFDARLAALLEKTVGTSVDQRVAEECFVPIALSMSKCWL